MKLRLSPWSAALGFLILLMIASILGLVPFITPWDVFWMVLLVACVWLIMRVFFSGKKR
jgi:hypothetical protein